MKLKETLWTTLLNAVLLATLLSGCGTTATERKEADYYYRMGISAVNEGDFQAAFVHFQKALQLSPDNKDVLNCLGLVYLQRDDPEKAKEYFLKVVSLDPANSEAYNSLGVAYSKTGQWQKAIESHKKALANPLYQTPEKAFYNLGFAYYRLGQYDLAASAFKDSLKRSPSSPLPYYGIALAYNKAGRYGDAAASLTKALESDPTYRGDKAKFMDDVKQRLVTAKGEEGGDYKDYLEILNY